jgi:hypothetical protein
MNWSDRLIIAISLIGLLAYVWFFITTVIVPIFDESKRSNH